MGTPCLGSDKNRSIVGYAFSASAKERFACPSLPLLRPVSAMLATVKPLDLWISKAGVRLRSDPKICSM
jgi:hypothetical protein